MNSIQKTVRQKTGSIIYSPFSDQKQVFMLNSGYVIAYTYQDDGKRRIHLIYGPGSYFPVLTTFNSTEQRATYEAITEVVYTQLPAKVFTDKIRSNHDFNQQILQKTVDQLAIFADRIIELQLTKLEDKLLTRLRHLAKTHGTLVDTVYVQLPYKLRHHHLSDMLGAERESISRCLESLKQKSAVRLNANGLLEISIT